MAFTMQSVMNLARLDINDSSTSTSNYRYPDSELLSALNDGIASVLVMRPDLNYGNYNTAFTDLAASDNFPLPIEYRPALTAYTVSRIQMGDDAFVLDGRSQLEMARYLKEIGLG